MIAINTITLRNRKVIVSLRNGYIRGVVII